MGESYLVCLILLSLCSWTALPSPLEESDPCRDVKPVCNNGTCMCHDTRDIHFKCNFVKGPNNDTCGQCCRGRSLDDGMCALCEVCKADDHNVLDNECSKEGTSRQCKNVSLDPVNVEKCVDVVPAKLPVVDGCRNVPECDDQENCHCNDTADIGCIFVRGNGKNKVCARCCTGHYWDDGVCTLCGTCPAQDAVTMEECEIDGSDKVCRSGEQPVDPLNCTPPSKDNNIPVLIGVICAVALFIVGGVVCCCYKRKKQPERIYRAWRNWADNEIIGPAYQLPPEQSRSEPGFNDVIGHAVDDERNGIDENAPGQRLGNMDMDS